MQKIEILNSKGNKVKAQIEFPQDEKNTSNIVIACHGLGGNKNSSTIVALTNKLIKSGIGVVSFDFTGHGESEVSPRNINITNCIEDIKAVEEYVRNEYPDSKVGIFASSFGGAVSLSYLLKLNKKVDSLILRCPAIDMAYILKNVLAKGKSKGVDKNGFLYEGLKADKEMAYSLYEDTQKYNLYELYKENPTEMLILHGKKDDIVPIELVEKFVNIHPKLARLEVFEEADHRFKKAGEMDKLTDICLKYYNESFKNRLER